MNSVGLLLCGKIWRQTMATKKTEPKKKTASKNIGIYRDEKYTILDRTEDKVMLTDGLIHFWVKAEDVKAD